MSFLFNQQLMFGLIGGLGLFLFGMKIMSEGLQKIAGEKMRQILSSLTSHRLVAALVGISVTALIQSSSATTVMVVGFVNAGLLSLMQAIGVILGVNIGSTITAQIIAFNVTQYALPAIGVGAALRLFSKKRRVSYLGEIVLGFGLVFLGLTIMRQGFDPLRTSEGFQQLFMLVGDYKSLGILIGTILTIITQSSIATLGLTLALATSGLISFEAGVALILGENIGTTITANISAIGTNIAARRAAFAHFLFNFIGVILMLIFFQLYLKLITSITPGEADFVVQTQAQADQYATAIGDKPHIARYIANAHTLFNVINTLIFLPFIGVLAKLSTYFIRGEGRQEIVQVRFIDDRVLNTPPIAIGQARRETRRMAQLAFTMLEETNRFLDDNDLRRIPELEKNEATLDLLQQEIMNFLTKLSHRSISADTSEQIKKLMNIVDHLERIGDHCQTLWELNTRKINDKIKFSHTGANEVAGIADRTYEFLRFVIDAMEQDNQDIMQRSMEYEDSIDALEDSLRMNHITRLNTGECAVQPGLIFIDMLQCYEKIGDHTFKISDTLVGGQ
ncbi:Na/Pi cotransporter family protein [Pelovirga terrestris]|uniref:Na/Pi cotransporter family protein n=1 Tax=Pelovirga terrestris TaxID=2771352 RepID=A0A8J6UHG7_9BACT|nr:Na/Pi cotransporter family protein [Pelovirga terrestris]MBD1399285.1 Na/Pi cotransporter family protein [Pelovirga terrestris]